MHELRFVLSLHLANSFCITTFCSVLIDDNQQLAEKWELRGGIFIHHTSTEETLRKLKEVGVLPKEDNEVSCSNVDVV